MRIVLSVIMGATLLLAACSETPTMKFQVGITQSELIERYGRPDTTQQMIKQSEAIWGAIESYWDQNLDSGDVVTIWYYASQTGTWELYFRNNDSLVGGVAFAPEGVVY